MSDKMKFSPPVVVAAATDTSADPAVSAPVRAAWLALWALLFAPVTHPAWVRLSYVMVRGDKGTGRAQTNVTLADGTDLGTTWATVCEHGTVALSRTGAAAEERGRTRRVWCEACSKGAPATVAGLPGAAPVPAPAAPVKAPRKARTGAAPTRARKARTAAPAAPADTAPADAPPAPGEAPAL